MAVKQKLVNTLLPSVVGFFVLLPLNAEKSGVFIGGGFSNIHTPRVLLNKTQQSNTQYQVSPVRLLKPQILTAAIFLGEISKRVSSFSLAKQNALGCVFTAFLAGKQGMLILSIVAILILNSSSKINPAITFFMAVVWICSTTSMVTMSVLLVFLWA